MPCFDSRDRLSRGGGLKLYCDTNTLLSNIRDEPAEQVAVEILVAAHDKGIVVLHRFRRR
jgi:hypothetical protein